MTRPRVYVDSNVFIEAFEQDSARADHARWVLDAVEHGRLTAVSSELALAETLVRPLQTGADRLAEAYQVMFRGGVGFEVVPVATSILVEAARIRAERPAIRLPDAIHIATARASGCTTLVSGDTRMVTRAGPPVMELGPHTVDDIVAVRSP